MASDIQNLLNNKTFQQLVDVRNIALYIFGIMVLAIAWSGAKTVQNNYELQKQIAQLKQQNEVLWLQNNNTYLQSEYYKTDEYLELSARQNLGLAAPGEKVMIVPNDVAMKYVNPNLDKQSDTQKTVASDTRAGYVKNLEDWRDFLLGRRLFSD